MTRPISMLRVMNALAVLLVAVIAGAVSAFAETRVALVIGNGAYKHAPALANPKNDAEGMAASLKRLGFEVLAGTDLEKGPMERLLRDFAQKIDGADVALVFYAGHGLQGRGRNYFVPVDAKLDRPTDVVFETVPLDLVQEVLDQAKCRPGASCWVTRTKHCGTVDTATQGYVQWIGVYGTDAAAFTLCGR